jgi:hypothetical protein
VDEWTAYAPRLSKSGVKLAFISIGDAEKLSLFLENNPKADPSLFLVEGYSFDAYKAMGFGKLLDDREATKTGAKNLKPPKFGFAKWRSYLSTVGRLSPIPKGSLGSRQFPEGVTRLGGTIGVSGEDVVYLYAGTSRWKTPNLTYDV